MDVDTDELRDIATYARAVGDDPCAVVDQTVRAALTDLAAWAADLSQLAQDLLDVSPSIALDTDTVAAGRALDERLHRAREQLLGSVTEYHHGSAGPEPVARPW